MSDTVSTISISAILSLLTGLTGMYFGYKNFQRIERKDSARDGKESATILTELGYIKSGIDDLKRKQEKADERHIEIVTRLTSVEASTKQAHKRIDELIEKEVAK